MSWKPEHGRPPGKILLIQLRRIGDSVLVAPAVDALRAAWPDAALHLLTEEPVPDLFRDDPRLGPVRVRRKGPGTLGIARELRREGYDLVLDFQSLPITCLLSRATGAHTVGFRGRGRSYHRAVSLDDHRGSHYSADHKLDLLRAVGLEPQLVLPRLVTPDAPADPWGELPAGPRVALVPVSPWAHKRWAPEAFAESARRLHAATGAVFVLAGGPGEGEILEPVASGLEGVPHAVTLFRRVRDFTAFLAGADLYLGNDNGPRHLALASGTPTIAYFRDHNPTHWTPPGTDRHPVIWDRAHARGGFVREDLVILPEEPDAVASAAAGLLREPRV